MTAGHNLLLPIFGGGLTTLVVGAAVFGLMLRLLTRLVAGFFPSFRSACLGWILGWIAAWAGALAVACVVALLEMVMRLVGHPGLLPGGNLNFGGESLALALVALAAKPAVYRAMLKGPEGQRLSFGKGFAIAVIELFVVAIIYVAAVVLLLAIGGRPQM